MATFVELPVDPAPLKVYVNPELVVSIEESDTHGQCVLAWGDGNAITVLLSATETYFKLSPP